MNPSGIPRRGLLSILFISPDERRLRAFWRLVILVILVLLFTLIFSIVMLVLPLTGFTAAVVSELVAALAGTAAVFLARRVVDRRPITSLGLHLDTSVLKDLAFGFITMGLLMGLIYLAEWALGWLEFSSFAWQSQTAGEVLGQIVLPTLALFILVGWFEELIFRGYVLQNLNDGLGPILGLVVSSLAFALMHSFNPGISPVALAGLFLAGLFLAYGYLRTRSLWLPVGLHIGWNFFEGPVFGFPVSGLSIPRLVNQVETGPDLWTGGIFGPEAGLIVLPALALGAYLIFLYSRRRNPAATEAGLPANAPDKE